MNADTIKAIETALTPLANKIGEGAAHVYSIYVRQQFVVGVTDLIWAAVGAGLIAAGILNFRWCFSKAREDDYNELEWHAFGGVTLGVGLIIGGLMFSVSLTDGVTHLLNPEYYAIQDLLSTVKGQ